MAGSGPGGVHLYFVFLCASNERERGGGEYRYVLVVEHAAVKLLDYGAYSTRGRIFYGTRGKRDCSARSM